LSLLSLDNKPINSFDLLTNWLQDNKSWVPTAYPATGDMTKRDGVSWSIIGIALLTPHELDKIKFYFDPNTEPPFRIDLPNADFESISDNII
jgi:hypothetical protein